jgi:hypothetical protein
MRKLRRCRPSAAAGPQPQHVLWGVYASCGGGGGGARHAASACGVSKRRRHAGPALACSPCMQGSMQGEHAPRRRACAPRRAAPHLNRQLRALGRDARLGRGVQQAVAWVDGVPLRARTRRGRVGGRGGPRLPLGAGRRGARRRGTAAAHLRAHPLPARPLLANRARQPRAGGHGEARAAAAAGPARGRRPRRRRGRGRGRRRQLLQRGAGLRRAGRAARRARRRRRRRRRRQRPAALRLHASWAARAARPGRSGGRPGGWGSALAEHCVDEGVCVSRESRSSRWAGRREAGGWAPVARRGARGLGAPGASRRAQSGRFPAASVPAPPPIRRPNAHTHAPLAGQRVERRSAARHRLLHRAGLTAVRTQLLGTPPRPTAGSVR